MDEKKEDFYKTFEILRKHCSNKLYLKKTDSGEIIIRSDIKDSLEVEAFVRAYEVVSHSRFVVYRSSKSGSKIVYSKIWICYRRAFRKTSGKYGSCLAKINVSIKHNTKSTRKRDSFMRMKPPFATVIRIRPEHNHSVMDCQALKGLKLSHGIKECFYEYFSNDIFGLKAKRLHEQNLRKAIFFSLDDASMNPRMDYIYRLQKKWKESVEKTKLKKVSKPDVSKSVQESKDNAKSMQKSKALTISVQEPIADIKSVQKSTVGAEEDKYLDITEINCGFLNVKEVVSKLENDFDVEDCVMEKIANDIIEDLERGDVKEDSLVRTSNSMLTTSPIIITFPAFYPNYDFGAQNAIMNNITNSNISSSLINLQNYNGIPNAVISQTTNGNVLSSLIKIPNHDSVVQNDINKGVTDPNATSSSIKIQSYGSVIQNVIKNSVTDQNVSLSSVSPQSKGDGIANFFVKQEIDFSSSISMKESSGVQNIVGKQQVMDENVSSSISTKESNRVQNDVCKQEVVEGDVSSSISMKESSRVQNAVKQELTEENIDSSSISMQNYSTGIQHPKQEITNTNVSSPSVRIQNYGCVLQHAVINKNVNFYGKIPIQPKLPPKRQVVIYDVTTNAYRTFTVSTTPPSGTNKLCQKQLQKKVLL